MSHGRACCPEEGATAYDTRQRQHGKSPARALRALANQWVRGIYALWVTQERYAP
jgi:hypothetical protein